MVCNTIDSYHLRFVIVRSHSFSTRLQPLGFGRSEGRYHFDFGSFEFQLFLN